MSVLMLAWLALTSGKVDNNCPLSHIYVRRATFIPGNVYHKVGSNSLKKRKRKGGGRITVLIITHSVVVFLFARYF